MDSKVTHKDPATTTETWLDELFGSYINIFLLLVCLFLIFKIVHKHYFEVVPTIPVAEPTLQPMPKRDFTIQELRNFDGRPNENNLDNRVLLGVNGNVIDVSPSRHLYGPGGPYDLYAGRDASRGLATFSVTPDVIRDEFDDLSDLKPSELESMREWETQLRAKYDVVGRLLRPSETHADYDEGDGDSEKEKKNI